MESVSGPEQASAGSCAHRVVDVEACSLWSAPLRPEANFDRAGLAGCQKRRAGVVDDRERVGLGVAAEDHLNSTSPNLPSVRDLARCTRRAHLALAPGQHLRSSGIHRWRGRCCGVGRVHGTTGDNRPDGGGPLGSGLGLCTACRARRKRCHPGRGGDGCNQGCRSDGWSRITAPSTTLVLRGVFAVAARAAVR